MQRYQVKTCQLETKLDAPGRKVMGYFAAFGNKDSDGDVIVKGAFAKTIAERGPRSQKPRILFLRDHDSSKVVGRVDELREDEKGLYFEAQIAQTPLGDETLELYKLGALTEHSIGYQTVKSRFDNEHKANVLEELKLWEGSVVPWGANEQTPVVGFKSWKPDAIERLTELAKQAPDDDYKAKMLLFIEQLKAEAEQEEALEGKEQPTDEATAPVIEPQEDAELKALISELTLLKDILGGKKIWQKS